MQGAGIYLEKQHWQLCAIHAVNNLLQRPHFNKQRFDEIVSALSGRRRLISPHCSPIGLGNYDVNVIIQALDQIGYVVQWYDNRRGRKQLENHLHNACIVGVLVNIPTTSCCGFYSSRHWFTIRPIPQNSTALVTASNWFVLDSRRPEPTQLGHMEQALNFLEDLITEGSHIFLVFTASVTGNNSTGL
ncbi:Josephin protein [Pelomyxa schiedti]|nr:Josephin protein [Pelomyxa schiedti]